MDGPIAHNLTAADQIDRKMKTGEAFSQLIQDTLSPCMDIPTCMDTRTCSKYPIAQSDNIIIKNKENKRCEVPTIQSFRAWRT